MVTPSPKEEKCTGKINGTVVQRARFDIGHGKYLQQLATVNLGRWRDSSTAVKEGSRRLFGCPPRERGIGRIVRKSYNDGQSSQIVVMNPDKNSILISIWSLISFQQFRKTTVSDREIHQSTARNVLTTNSQHTIQSR
jgi:hypothetical protein